MAKTEFEYLKMLKIAKIQIKQAQNLPNHNGIKRKC